jgi:hypothetical protein
VTLAAQKILRDVLELPESDRLKIVLEILAGLDGPADPDWEAAWLAELDRRERSEPAEPTNDEEWAKARARILTSASRRGA